MSNRSPSFVAVHRGGLLSKSDHYLMASWAADCAEHVVYLYENSHSDGRPRQAIATARAWAATEASVGDAREAAFAAHAAARKADTPWAIAAARAAGHAVATAHMADHCLRTMQYALNAVEFSAESEEDELQWQLMHLREDLRPLILSGLEQHYPKVDLLIDRLSLRPSKPT